MTSKDSRSSGPATSGKATASSPVTGGAKTGRVTKADLEQQVQVLQSQLDYANETISRLREELDGYDDERQRILSIQDYAIGMEQELGQALFDLSQRNEIDHSLRMEIIDTHARLAAAIQDSQAAHLRLAHSPMAFVRRRVGAALRKAGLR